MGDFAVFNKQGAIGVITMNHPKTGNCVDTDSYIDLEAAFREAAADDEVKVIVFTGAGKHFSTGGNIRYFLERVEKKEGFSAEEMSITSRVAFQIRMIEKPTIAMINGCAYGAGMPLALACDFRIAEEGTQLSTAFIGMGLPGDTAGTYFLGKMVGAAKTTELMMTGRPVSAKEAFDLGLVTKVVEKEKLEEATMKLAGRLAKGPVRAYAQQKKLINEFVFECKNAEAYGKAESEAMSEASYSEDFRNAVYAFLKK